MSDPVSVFVAVLAACLFVLAMSTPLALLVHRKFHAACFSCVGLLTGAVPGLLIYLGTHDNGRSAVCASLGTLIGALAAGLISLSRTGSREAGGMRCLSCGHDLFGITERRCPSCGRAV